MLTVFKYPIPAKDDFTLSLPEGAKILTVQTQPLDGYEEPRIWCLVDEAATPEVRYFRLTGTGHPIDIPEDWLYHIGTFQTHHGKLVWHLFEVIQQEAT